jgi:hypothetical protein
MHPLAVSLLNLKQATPRMKILAKMSAAAGSGEHVAGFMNSSDQHRLSHFCSGIALNLTAESFIGRRTMNREVLIALRPYARNQISIYNMSASTRFQNIG